MYKKKLKTIFVLLIKCRLIFYLGRAQQQMFGAARVGKYLNLTVHSSQLKNTAHKQLLSSWCEKDS